jgi:predicted  nucleic acid-binding Zn-ribbon protein
LLRAFIETIHATRTYTYNRVTRSHAVEVTATAPSSAGMPAPATGTTEEDRKKAIRHLESLLWLNEQNPSLHHQLGLLYYHDGDKLRALSHLQRAGELLPADPEVRHSLDVLYPELVTTLVSDLGGKTDHVQNLEVHTRNLQTELEGIKAHVANLEARRIELETHTANLESRNAELETHVANLEGQAVTLKARAAEVETHAANLETHASNLETRVAHVETHATNLEEHAGNLQVHADNLEAERLRLTKWIESQSQQLDRYAMQLFGSRLDGMISEIRRDGVADVVVYGAGEVAQVLVSMCLAEDIRVRCAVDSKPDIWGQEIHGVRIVPIDEAMKFGVDAYAVASLSSTREISREIRERYATTTRRPRIYAATPDPPPGPGAAPVQPVASSSQT